MGDQPLAVILCRCSDQPQTPQPPAFFQAFFTAQDPRSWGSPFRIPDGGESVARTGGAVATVAQTADHLDVFWIGNNGAIWTNWWDGTDPNGTWAKHAPFSITSPNAAPGGGGIAAVSQHAGHLDVFWAGTDGAIWTQWWDASDAKGAWSAHSALRVTAPNSTIPGGGIAAVSQYSGHLDVFWTSNDGAIWTTWWDATDPNGAWDRHTPFAITTSGYAQPGGATAAVSQFANHLDLFWIGADGAIWTNWWDGSEPNGAWAGHSAFTISNAASAPPGGSVTTIAQNPGHLDVFWVGNDGAVWTQWWDANDPNGPWANHAAFAISARKSAPAGGGVAVACRFPGQLDVFWADTTAAISSTFWNANLNNAQWNTPFQVTAVGLASGGGGIAAVARQQFILDVFWADLQQGVSTDFWPAPSPWSLANYWRDMSYGQFTINGSRIFGWDTIPQTKAAFQSLGRQAQLQACLSASQALHPELANYSRVVAVVNVAANSGATGSNAVFGPEAWTSTFAEHESGHMLGLDHSFDDRAASCDPNNDGRAGAYSDGWDIMSASCFDGQNPVVVGAFGPAGPGLNAPNRDLFGWIPAARSLSISAGSLFNSTVTLAALSEVIANGYLMLKLFPDGSDPGRYYTLEFRRLDGWDVGIARNTLLVHFVEDGLTYLVTADNGPERVAGNAYAIHQVPQGLPVRHTGVATVAQKPGHLDVFWVGTDGGIWTNWWDATDPNGAWNHHSEFRITSAGLAPGGAGIAAVSQAPGHLDVFWTGNDGAIWTDWWDANLPDGPWSKHGPFAITSPNIAPPGAAVAAVSRYSGHLDVFWAGNDGAIWTNWWDATDPSGAWDKHTAFRITARRATPPGAGICAVAQTRDHLDVFWADSQGAVATNWWDAHDPNGPWKNHSAFRITLRKRLPPGAPISAVSQNPGHLDVFWVGSDGAIWTNWWDSAAANGPWWDPTQNANALHGPEKSFAITNPKLSPVTPGAGITAVTQNQGHLDVFWVANDGAVWTNWWDAGGPGGAWPGHSPFPITSANNVPQGGSIAATVQRRGHLDIFWADAGGAISSNWWDASDPNGPWSNHNNFPITAPNVVPPAAPITPTEQYQDEQFSLAVQTIDAASSTATVHVIFN